MPRTFDMPHLVTFEETNVVGNVYFAHYFSWQGRCRELFLREHAPDTVAELASGALRMVTAHASCDYLDEFAVFDRITVRLSLNRFIAYGVSLNFAFCRDGETLARGRQDIKFLRRHGDRWELADVPESLGRAARDYA